MSKPVSVEVKTAIVERLRVLAGASGGVVPDEAVRSAAAQCGVTSRTVWRWLNVPAFKSQKKATLSREELTAVALHHGNVQAAWEDLRQRGLQISYTQFWRRLQNTDSDLVAGVTAGVDAAIQQGQYVQRETPRKMSMVGFDHTELSVFCAPDGVGAPVKPWISVIQDWGTRYILGIALTSGRGMRGDPVTETVVALVGGVLVGFEAPDGTSIGGMIKVIVADNANAHLAEAVANGYAFLGILPHFIAPGSPWQNGRTERLVKTIEAEFCARQPGYSHHLPLRYGKHAWSKYISIEELAVRLDAWMIRYNTERPHAGLGGRTPLEAWKEDATIVERVNPSLVRHGFMAAKRVRKISKNGVRFRSIDYTAPELAGKTGRKASVRYLPNDRSFIDVYIDGEYLCTAVPHEALTLEQRADIARIRRSRIGRIDRIMKTAARQREEEAFAEDGRVGITTGVGDRAIDEDQETYLRIVEGKTEQEDE